jgi:hypothetical protein
MLASIDQDVPTDRPLLICYESSWRAVKTNTVLRADPNIKDSVALVRATSVYVRRALNEARASTGSASAAVARDRQLSS